MPCLTRFRTSHFYRPKTVIKSKLSWKIILKLFKIWLVTATLLIHIYFILLLNILRKARSGNKVLTTIFGALISALCFIVTLHFLFIQRRKIVTLIQDFMDALYATNLRRYLSIHRRFKIYFCSVLGYALFLSMLGVIISYFGGCTDYVLTSAVYGHTFNSSLPIPALLRMSVAFDYILFSVTSVGFGFLLAAIFSILPLVVETLMNDLTDALKEATFDKPSYMDTWRRNFHRVRSLVDRTNDVMENYLFFWYGYTLVNTCYNSGSFLMRASYENPIRMIYFFFSDFQDLFNLTLVTMYASRIPESADRMLDEVPTLAEKGMVCGRGKEVHLLYQELTSNQMGLRVGGCFLITKNLFLSFLGLGVTYAVVGAQLFPNVVKGVHGSLETNYTC